MASRAPGRPAFLPTLPEALFSLKSYAASMAALYISYAAGLPRPFWAMMTAYIVSGPLSGAVRSKGVFRVIGTVLGSSAAVLLVPALADAPELLSLALALWVAGCLYLSLLDRTPRSYLFMLAGYTAGMIGFAGVADPESIFDTGLARVEEITLGILCATVIHSVVFPRAVGPVLMARLDATLRDAERWTRDALSLAPSCAEDRERLARDLTELRMMATHLPYDTSDVRWTARSVRALQDRMTYLLPILAAVEDRLAALRADGGNLPSRLVAALEDLTRWLAVGDDDDASRRGAESLRGALAGLAPRVTAELGWRDATLLNLVSRLRALIDIHQDCRELRSHIHSGDPMLPERLDPLARSRSGGLFHRDHGMALWSGAAAVVAITAMCAFWIATGWTSGAMAAVMVSVFSCFFASLDDPAPGLRTFFLFTLLSMPIAGFYILLVIPALHSFGELAIALAPTLLGLGVLVARPATMGRAMATLLGVAGAFSLMDTGSGDFVSFVNSDIGQLAGIGTALLVMRLGRTIGAAWSARRLLRAGWREIAAMAGASSPRVAEGFENRMLDRVGLLSARLAVVESQEGLDAADAVNDLRIGLNLAELQRARGGLSASADAAVARLMEAVRRHFATLSSRLLTPPPPTILPALDEVLAGVAAAPATAERNRAVIALAGLRRGLFPATVPSPADALEHPKARIA